MSQHTLESGTEREPPSDKGEIKKSKSKRSIDIKSPNIQDLQSIEETRKGSKRQLLTTSVSKKYDLKASLNNNSTSSSNEFNSAQNIDKKVNTNSKPSVGRATSEKKLSKSSSQPDISISRSIEKIFKATEENGKLLSEGQERADSDLEDDELRIQKDIVVDDANILLTQFNDAFFQISRRLQKPNVLLTGITGAGKSSIINAIFAENIAETGTGVPITQHFVKYESDELRVVIYDSKGLEHGAFEQFMSDTEKFFDDHEGTRSTEKSPLSHSDAIHVIWYIINSAHSRWEPFEARLCRELYKNTPLIFILNKSDISSSQDRQKIRQLIQDMKLPNCVGIFDTIARPLHALKSYDRCPICKSDDLVIINKTATLTCQDCKHTESLKQSDGLSDVIEATCTVLPDVVRDQFISAQNVSFHLKEQRASQILTAYWTEFNDVRLPQKFYKLLAKLMARLAIVWEFRSFGQLYGATVASELSGTFKWKDRVNLLIHKNFKRQKTQTTALGVLWSRCLKEFAIALFTEWSKNWTLANRLKIEETFRTCFTQLNEDNLAEITKQITSSGLESVIEREIEKTEEILRSIREKKGKKDDPPPPPPPSSSSSSSTISTNTTPALPNLQSQHPPQQPQQQTQSQPPPSPPLSKLSSSSSSSQTQQQQQSNSTTSSSVDVPR
eukprot:TRINITY_DN767_c0_g2_i1.p1 TRINITY_DN767_c0_g2~~TRINITY_DN767_c0_g2_i1.p1  ORF type:complete len:671 (-),score=177.37 TRINITY_DN767_c0_g2_i1:775-2787(-)